MSFFVSLHHKHAWSKTQKEAVARLRLIKNKPDNEYLACFECEDMR